MNYKHKRLLDRELYSEIADEFTSASLGLLMLGLSYALLFGIYIPAIALDKKLNPQKPSTLELKTNTLERIYSPTHTNLSYRTNDLRR